MGAGSCPNCGAEIKGTYTFCKNCGARIEQQTQAEQADITAKAATPSTIGGTRKYINWKSITIFVTTVVALAVGLFFIFRGGAAQEELATCVPGNSLYFGTMILQQGEDPLGNLETILSRFPFYREMRQDGEAELQDYLADLSISKDELQAALDGRIGLCSIPYQDGNYTYSMDVWLAEVKEEQADRLLASITNSEDLEYEWGEHDLVKYEDEEIYVFEYGMDICISDNVFMMGEEEAIEKCIDTMKGKEASCAQMDNFAVANDQLSGDREFFAFVDVRNLIDSSDADGDDSIFNRAPLSNIKSLGITARTTEDGLEAEVVMIDEGQARSLAELAPRCGDGALKYVPAEAKMVLLASNPAMYFRKIEEVAGQVYTYGAENFQDIRDDLRDEGIDLEEDILSWTAGDCALVFSPIQGEMALIIEVSDAELANSKLDELASVIEEMADYDLWFDSTEYDGMEIHYADIGYSSYDYYSGYSYDYDYSQLEVSYSLVGNALVITVAEDMEFMESIINVARGGAQGFPASSFDFGSQNTIAKLFIDNHDLDGEIEMLPEDARYDIEDLVQEIQEEISSFSLEGMSTLRSVYGELFQDGRNLKLELSLVIK